MGIKDRVMEFFGIDEGTKEFKRRLKEETEKIRREAYLEQAKKNAVEEAKIKADVDSAKYLEQLNPKKIEEKKESDFFNPDFKSMLEPEEFK